MTLFHEVARGFDVSMCDWLCLGLMHFVWQATAIALLSIAVGRAFNGRTSQFRYGCQLTALLAMAACVPINLFVIARPTSVPPGEAVDIDIKVATSSVDSPAFSGEQPRVSHGAAEPFADNPAVARTDVQSSREIPTTHIPAVVTSYTSKKPIAVWLVILWILGTTLMLFRLLFAMTGSWRLGRASRRVTERSVLFAVSTQTKRLGLTFKPIVRWCERISVPVVCGIVRPVVLLPPALIAGLDPAQVDAILAHELAHIRRLDPLVNILQRVLESLLFFHPAVWCVSRQISAERESCCDDLVVEVGTSPVVYADALVRMAELCSVRVPSTVVAATGQGKSELNRRVRRLLLPEASASVRNPLSLFLVVAVVATISNAAIVVHRSQERASKTSAHDHPEGLIRILGEDRGRYWGHASRLVLAPDEKRVFLTESLGYVSAFDAETLHRVMQFRPHQQRCLDIAMVDRGRKLVTFSTDGTVALWDLSTGGQPAELDRQRIIEGSKKTAWLSMSSGRNTNRFVVRASESGSGISEQLSMFEVTTDGKLNRKYDFEPAASAAWQFAMSPSGRWLVTGEKAAGGPARPVLQDTDLVVYDLEEEKPRAVSRYAISRVERMQFLDDDTLWAADSNPIFGPGRESESSKQQGHTWSLEDGRLIRGPSHDDTSNTFSPRAFSRDGRYTAASSPDGLLVSRITNGSHAAMAKLRVKLQATPTFLADGSLIVASSPYLQRWDLDGGKYESRPAPTGHKSRVTEILFDPRTNSLLTAGDISAQEWKLENQSADKEIAPTKLPFNNVGDMWIWPGGKGFVLARVVDGSHIIQGVRRAGKLMLTRFRIDFGEDRPWCAAVHPTRNIVATGHHNHQIKIWDIGTGTPTQLVAWKAHAGHVCDIAFSPDGKSLVSAGWDRTTVLWDIPSYTKSAKPTRRGAAIHRDIVRSVAYSGDGRYIASGSESGKILLWDTEDLEDLKWLKHPEDAPGTDSLNPKTPDSLQFNKAGTKLLSADGMGRVTVWSIPECTITKRWQLPGWVWAARFSPDESMIGIGNDDGTVYLLKSPGK